MSALLVFRLQAEEVWCSWAQHSMTCPVVLKPVCTAQVVLLLALLLLLL